MSWSRCSARASPCTERRRRRSRSRSLLDAERHRRGEPDATGAFHALALIQGPLLKHEYDLSTHGHYEEGWEIGAVIVDVQSLITINEAHGFLAGDTLLRLLVATLGGVFPTGKIVRIHSDAFAVLLPPSAEREMTESLSGRVDDALKKSVALATGFTISLLALTISKPSHWQVLGPLVWAECERAHTMTRAGQASGIQRRRVELDAAVPMTTL